MNSEIVQAAKLQADFLYKNYTLGIQVCEDARICKLIIKDFLSECGITSDCDVVPVALTTFNQTRTCSDISVITQSNSQVTCNPPSILFQCTYSVTINQLIPIKIVGSNFSYELSQSIDISTLSGRNSFKAFLENVLINATATITDLGGGNYSIIILTTDNLKYLLIADDFINETNIASFFFTKNCEQ